MAAGKNDGLAYVGQGGSKASSSASPAAQGHSSRDLPRQPAAEPARAADGWLEPAHLTFTGVCGRGTAMATCCCCAAAATRAATSAHDRQRRGAMVRVRWIGLIRGLGDEG